MKVKDVMVSNPRTCAMSDDLATAARLMWENDCGCIPVLGGHGRVVGMITDRDICMAAFFQGVPLDQIRTATIMSRQLFVCASDDDLAAAEGIMCDKKVRRLPVLDEQGRLVGLLSVSDIAVHAYQEGLQRTKKRTVTAAQVARLVAAVSKPRRGNQVANNRRSQ